MVDLTQNHYFQQILVGCRLSHGTRHLKSDPHIGPGTVAVLREALPADRDDAQTLREIVHNR